MRCGTLYCLFIFLGILACLADSSACIKNTASPDRYRNKMRGGLVPRCIKQKACHHEHHHHNGKYTIGCDDNDCKSGKHGETSKLPSGSRPPWNSFNNKDNPEDDLTPYGGVRHVQLPKGGFKAVKHDETSFNNNNNVNPEDDPYLYGGVRHVKLPKGGFKAVKHDQTSFDAKINPEDDPYLYGGVRHVKLPKGGFKAVKQDETLVAHNVNPEDDPYLYGGVRHVKLPKGGFKAVKQDETSFNDKINPEDDPYLYGGVRHVKLPKGGFSAVKHEKRCTRGELKEQARGEVFSPPYPFSMDEVVAMKKVNVTIEQNGKDPIAINVIIRNNSKMNVTIMNRNSPVDKDAFNLGHFRVYPDDTKINFAPEREEYEWYHTPKGMYSRPTDPRKKYLASDLTHLGPNETVKQTIIIPSGTKEENEQWLEMIRLADKVKMRVEGKWFAIGAWDKEPRWSRYVDFKYVSNTIDLEIPKVENA